MSKGLLTPKDLCDRWKVTIHTIYKWTSTNKLAALKIGGLRFREEDIEKFENEHFSGGVKTALL